MVSGSNPAADPRSSDCEARSSSVHTIATTSDVWTLARLATVRHLASDGAPCHDRNQSAIVAFLRSKDAQNAIDQILSVPFCDDDDRIFFFVPPALRTNDDIAVHVLIDGDGLLRTNNHIVVAPMIPIEIVAISAHSAASRLALAAAKARSAL